MTALGIDLCTHMARAHELACAAGARCTFIGNGSPLPPPVGPAVKDIPVAYMEGDNWRPLAEEVARNMATPVHAIPAGDHDTVMEAVGRARVLLWPARLTGHGRVLWEARALGTVAVGLASNIYATGLNEESGAIVADSLESMPQVVESLLGNPERLQSLAQAGRRSAQEQVDWSRYVERVDRALSATEDRPEDPAAGARAAFGERLGAHMDDRTRVIARVLELDAALADAGARVEVLDEELASARQMLQELGRHLQNTTERSATGRDAPTVALLAELRRRVTRRMGALRRTAAG
jgi:hypothetical protein